MNAVNPLNILNTLNLEHGGALNGRCKCSKHSEHSEFHGGALNGCFESSKHSEPSEFGTWWCFEWML